MKRFLQNSETDVWFSRLERPYKFQSPFASDEFIVMLVINDKKVTDDEQINISQELVLNGCRYAVCAGYKCSTWDDSIDYALIFSDPNLNPPNEKFVMTTWHEDESIEDIVHYFRWNTVFDEFVPKNFLVLFLGENIELKNQTFEALKKFFD